MLEKLRSLFASAPKTLPQATATLTEAQAQVETLAAELTTRDERIAALTTELAEAEKQGETATAQLATAQAQLLEFGNRQSAFGNAFATLGLTLAPDLKPEAITAAWDAHVDKATTLALAKTGHPPAHVPAADTGPAAAPATDADILAEYEALSAKNEANARFDLFCKHELAIKRAIAARNKAAAK